MAPAHRHDVHDAARDEPLRTRVLVIGGGPVGLTLSLLLSRHGVPNLVVERRRETLRAPAAHVLRRRAMEIFDAIGVGDAVRRAASPLPIDFITWCATLGGEEIGRLDLRPADAETGARPGAPWTNCSQNRLEPILLRAARLRPEARILVGAECVSFEPGEDGVAARVQGDDGSQRDVVASFAVAADGAGSPTRRALGIGMEGAGPLARMSMVHFEADLTPWLRDRPGPIYWILNPDSPGALIVHEPRHSHVFMMPRPPEGRKDEIPRRLDAALAVPVGKRILSVDDWSPHVQVAARYRAGRVFLVGDAAHRFPPTGGLGLNTGIQEADDLAARLARVETGGAGEACLDGYETACRPAARRNADASFENMSRLGEIPRVLGVCKDLEALELRVRSLSQAERGQLEKAIEAQRAHFLCDGHLPDGAGSDTEACRGSASG